MLSLSTHALMCKQLGAPYYTMRSYPRMKGVRQSSSKFLKTCVLPDRGSSSGFSAPKWNFREYGCTLWTRRAASVFGLQWSTSFFHSKEPPQIPIICHCALHKADAYYITTADNNNKYFPWRPVWGTLLQYIKFTLWDKNMAIRQKNSNHIREEALLPDLLERVFGSNLQAMMNC